MAFTFKSDTSKDFNVRGLHLPHSSYPPQRTLSTVHTSCSTSFTNERNGGTLEEIDTLERDIELLELRLNAIRTCRERMRELPFLSWCGAHGKRYGLPAFWRRGWEDSETGESEGTDIEGTGGARGVRSRNRRETDKRRSTMLNRSRPAGVERSKTQADLVPSRGSSMRSVRAPAADIDSQPELKTPVRNLSLPVPTEVTPATPTRTHTPTTTNRSLQSLSRSSAPPTTGLSKSAQLSFEREREAFTIPPVGHITSLTNPEHMSFEELADKMLTDLVDTDTLSQGLKDFSFKDNAVGEMSGALNGNAFLPPKKNPNQPATADVRINSTRPSHSLPSSSVSETGNTLAIRKTDNNLHSDWSVGSSETSGSTICKDNHCLPKRLQSHRARLIGRTFSVRGLVVRKGRTAQAGRK